MQKASELVREAHGLEPLVAIIKDKNVRDKKTLMAAATGAIWKCATSDENVKQFDNVSETALAITAVQQYLAYLF